VSEDSFALTSGSSSYALALEVVVPFFTVLRHFEVSTHRAVAIGETDIQLVNEFLTSITAREAIAEAKTIRDKMIEVRDLLKPFASEKR
jgi:hypothetical protein